jgi:N4-gp56 family major capsid protein
MSDTSVNSSNRVQQWADDEFFEYVRMNPLKFLMGTGENSVIQVKEELTKEAGDRITFSLVTRLTGTGVTGDNTLEGNEEALGNYGHQVTVNQLRHGVVVGQFEKIKTKIDLLAAAKTMLRLWNMEQLRDLFIARLFSPVVDGLTTYSAATETQKDAWEVANNPSTANQRILFGAAKSNQSGDHSTDLGNIDGTADDAHPDIIRLLKRMAQSADPHIRPVVVGGSDKGAGGERFYALMGGLPFRDLEANMDTIHQNAGVRGDENHIFASGMIKVGNVICVEVPEMDRTPANGGCLLENVGNGGTVEVEPIFLVGAQALLLAWAQRMSVKMDEFDYQNKRGVAVAEIRGCEKTTYNSFQHGVATGYVSAVGD